MAAGAPELVVTRWFNTAEPLTVAGLHGRVVLIHAFQMLCPGCVAHGTPQAERAHRLFANTDLQVIGLHPVFEHHAAMTPVSLQAFIHEYRLTFLIGVDAPGEDTPIPITMGRYGMRGTPTMVLIGRDGAIRHHGFGQEDDMALGAMIALSTRLKRGAAVHAFRVRQDPKSCAPECGHSRTWARRTGFGTSTRFSERPIRNTLALVFQSPAVMETIMAGRLPRGLRLIRLTDLPPSWADQHAALGM